MRDYQGQLAEGSMASFHGLRVSDVESATGISRDLLRKWEVRYGFPMPDRDCNNERNYSGEQVLQLKLVKRLQRLGIKPSMVLGRSSAVLANMFDKTFKAGLDPDESSFVYGILDCLCAQDTAGVRELLDEAVAHLGLSRFASKLALSLEAIVSHELDCGRLGVIERQIFADQMLCALRLSISGLPNGSVSSGTVMLCLPSDSSLALNSHLIEIVLRMLRLNLVVVSCGASAIEMLRTIERSKVNVAVFPFEEGRSSYKYYADVEGWRFILPARVKIWAVSPMGGLKSKNYPGVDYINDLQSLRDKAADYVDIF